MFFEADSAVPEADVAAQMKDEFIRKTLQVMGPLCYHHESAALCSGKLLLFGVLFPLDQGKMHCDVSIILSKTLELLSKELRTLQIGKRAKLDKG